VVVPQTRRTVNPELELLRSPLLKNGQRVYRGELISVNLVDAEIKSVLLLFSEFTGLNISLGPDVHGFANARFSDIPWDEAFETFLEQMRVRTALPEVVGRAGALRPRRPNATGPSESPADRRPEAVEPLPRVVRDPEILRPAKNRRNTRWR